MKKLDIGQTVTILANFGVIAGLVFLGAQLQQTNRIMRWEALNQRDDRRIEHNTAVYENEDLASALMRLDAGEEVSPLDEYRVSFYYSNMFIRWDSTFQQIAEGILPESELRPEAVRRRIDYSPGMAELWREVGIVYSPEFVEWMEENVIDKP